AQWWDVDKTKLLDHLRWGKANAFQADSSWKPQIWAYCAADLARTTGGEKTANKCKDQYQGIKKNFSEVHAIRGLSGFRWDEGLKLVTATQDVWDRLFEAHPDSKCWQTTSFPLYDNMLFLVDGIITTGAGAFHAGTSPSQSTTVLQSSIGTSQNLQSTTTSQ
ncbi:hypothetical protein B0H14DRAFT_2286916, partial [Mycena olivaceomarginata]